MPHVRLPLALAVAAFAMAGSAMFAGCTRHAPPNKEDTMKVKDLYPLITTPALLDTRNFYILHFGFEVLFEASWFVYLSGPGEEGTRGAVLALMHPDHPSSPPGPEAFDGRGMILTIEVSDAAAVATRLREMGAPIVHGLTDEPWGQRRVVTRDPAGVLIDVVQQIAPAPGFWERYPVTHQRAGALTSSTSARRSVALPFPKHGHTPFSRRSVACYP